VALSDETKKKLLVGGGVGGLALLVGYFIVSGPRSKTAGPSSLPEGAPEQGAPGQVRMTQAAPSLPQQPFARTPAHHHMKRRDHDDDDDRDRCNERGEYGRKHKSKHKRRHDGSR
jgi:hypothetical protein